MRNFPDDRSPMAVAMHWASQVTSVSLEMALPALLGYWVGQYLGAQTALTALGAVVGLVAGMWHLIRLTQQMTGQPPIGGTKANRQDSSDKTSKKP